MADQSKWDDPPQATADPALAPLYIRRAMPLPRDAQDRVDEARAEAKAARKARRAPGRKLTLKQARKQVERERIEAIQALAQLVIKNHPEAVLAFARLTRLPTRKRGAPSRAEHLNFAIAVEMAARMGRKIKRGKRIAVAREVEDDLWRAGKARSISAVQNAYSARDRHEVEVQLALRGLEKIFALGKTAVANPSKRGRPGLGKPWEAAGVSRRTWFRRNKGK